MIVNLVILTCFLDLVPTTVWAGVEPPESACCFSYPMVNIGMHQGHPSQGGRVMTSSEVLAAIVKHGANVIKSNIVQSNTEPTLVVSLQSPLDMATLDNLSVELGQDAVAQRNSDGSGLLAGPYAGLWGGKYNPDYFRLHNSMTATEGLPWLSNHSDCLRNFPSVY